MIFKLGDASGEGCSAIPCQRFPEATKNKYSPQRAKPLKNYMDLGFVFVLLDESKGLGKKHKEKGQDDQEEEI